MRRCGHSPTSVEPAHRGTAACAETLVVEGIDGRRLTLERDEASELVTLAYGLVAADAVRRGLVAEPLRLALQADELVWLRMWLRDGGVAGLPEGASLRLLAHAELRRWPRLAAALYVRQTADAEEAYAARVDALPRTEAGEEARAYAACVHHALRQRLALPGRAPSGDAVQVAVTLTLPAVGLLSGSLYAQPPQWGAAGDPAVAAQRRTSLQALMRACELQRRWLRARGSELAEVTLCGDDFAPGVAQVELTATLRDAGR